MTYYGVESRACNGGEPVRVKDSTDSIRPMQPSDWRANRGVCSKIIWGV